MVRGPKTEPRKRPTQTRAQRTVDAILAATKRVLVKEGYEATTTNRIAELAGVSIGSLYQYFPGKGALVSALVEQHLARMLEVFTATAQEGGASTIEEAARTIIRAAFAAHRVNPKLQRVLLEQTARLGAVERIDAFESQTQALAERFLKEHRGELRPKNVALAARVTLLAVRGVTVWTVMRRPEELENDAFLDEITDMVVRYLVA